VAAAAEQGRSELPQYVAALLKATPPQLKEQHSSFTPLMRFACVAGHDEPICAEVGLTAAKSIEGILDPATTCGCVLHVVAVFRS
jgi:hypothetical protein